ncbi:hypothetical protein [Vagococcus allomyrinae]|nr:hypothetical protein [Vagococcus allomyrinae]
MKKALSIFEETLSNIPEGETGLILIAEEEAAQTEKEVETHAKKS